MNIDFPDLEQQLATLHKREREGLQSFKEAVERAQKSGLCLPTPKAPAFPLAKAAHVAKKSLIREHAVAPLPKPAPPPSPLPLPHGPKSTPTPAPELDNRTWTPHSAEGIALGRTLLNPWTPTDLQARLDGEKTRAYYWIAQWKRKGWIDTVGVGQYRKTEAFGI